MLLTQSITISCVNAGTCIVCVFPHHHAGQLGSTCFHFLLKNPLRAKQISQGKRHLIWLQRIILLQQHIPNPLYCYLLHSSSSFPPFWRFDIPLVTWRSWAQCLVLPRSGTQQQYAWAFSLLSSLHPPLSSALSSPLFSCEGSVCGVGGGGTVARRASAAEPVSNNDIIPAGLAGYEGSFPSPSSECSPVCMCKLACAVSDQCIYGYREDIQMSHYSPHNDSKLPCLSSFQVQKVRCFKNL